MKIDLRDRIGDGGYGDIWSAEDELGREVAVKFVRESAAVISDAEAHARALVRAAINYLNRIEMHSAIT